MTTEQNPTQVAWIHPGAPRPLCDVPWLGTSIVQSDGSVNFCCFSSAVVGNVNQASFQDIWNGPPMRQIREALTEQRLPQECQSSSCPMFRGDDLHYLFDRMEGPHRFKRTGTHDPHREIRQRLDGSEFAVNRRSVRVGGKLTITVTLRMRGEPLAVDLFVSLRSPDGALRFLPTFEDYALPYRRSLQLGGRGGTIKVIVLDRRLEETTPLGDYEVCAALFDPDSNPNLLSNCFWAASETMTVKPAHPIVAWGRRMLATCHGGDKVSHEGTWR